MALLAEVRIRIESGENVDDYTVDSISDALDSISFEDLVRQKLREHGVTAPLEITVDEG